jgi:hypothetical protein
MGSYQLPPDIADSFNSLSARVALLERGAPPARAAVKQTGVGQSIPNTGNVPVQFDTVEFDNGPMWNASTPTRLTVPAGIPAAVFLIIGSVRLVAGASPGVVTVYFRRNAGTSDLMPQSQTKFAATDSFSVQIMHVIMLHAGDYMQILIDHGAANPITASQSMLSLTSQG